MSTPLVCRVIDEMLFHQAERAAPAYPSMYRHKKTFSEAKLKRAAAPPAAPPTQHSSTLDFFSGDTLPLLLV